MSKNLALWIPAWLAIAMIAWMTFQPSGPPRVETAKAGAHWRWIGFSRPVVPQPADPPCPGCPPS